jgi:plasmid stability protein
MATLHVENVPDDLYEALRARAKRERRSMAAEVIRILEWNVPTEAELARRAEVFRRIEDIRSRTTSTDELQREGREER